MDLNRIDELSRTLATFYAFPDVATAASAEPGYLPEYVKAIATRRTPGCLFCRANNYPESIFRSHSGKDEFGNIICPIRPDVSPDRRRDLGYSFINPEEERRRVEF